MIFFGGRLQSLLDIQIGDLNVISILKFPE
jgi:hypothetical protein